VQSAQADLELQLIEAPAAAPNGIPTFAGVRVRNLGPDTASGVKVAINVPADALYLGSLTYGPRANYVFLESNAFQTALLPGQSATVSFYVTPRRGGVTTSSVQVMTSDQTDPNPANNTLSWTLDVGDTPAIPSILSVRKVRADFFDHTPIAEIQIDQAALNRLAPYSTFLPGSFDESARLGIPQAGRFYPARARHLHRSSRSRRNEAGLSVAKLLTESTFTLDDLSQPLMLVSMKRVKHVSHPHLFTYS
jgi:hypothetical protein